MDDEEAIRRLLELTMSQLGYEVECASDGSEAIELFTRAAASGRGFDGVLLDLTVPGRMGGKEAAAELRRIDPSVKVIVSSGYADIPILSEFQKYGFDDVIRKPYTRAELSDLLSRVIGAKQKAITTPRSSEGGDERYLLKAPLPAVWDKAGGERVSVYASSRCRVEEFFPTLNNPRRNDRCVLERAALLCVSEGPAPEGRACLNGLTGCWLGRNWCNAA
jgi:CheY-like chemotaxis protein